MNKLHYLNRHSNQSGFQPVRLVYFAPAPGPEAHEPLPEFTRDDAETQTGRDKIAAAAEKEYGKIARAAQREKNPDTKEQLRQEAIALYKQIQIYLSSLRTPEDNKYAALGLLRKLPHKSALERGAEKIYQAIAQRGAPTMRLVADQPKPEAPASTQQPEAVASAPSELVETDIPVAQVDQAKRILRAGTRTEFSFNYLDTITNQSGKAVARITGAGDIRFYSA